MSKTYSVWELVERVGSVQPLKPSQVESLLSAHVHVESENDMYQFWGGTAQLPLANNLKIKKITLTTNKPVKPDSLDMSIYLADGCVSKKELMTHFPKLKITDTPTGRSLNEETIFEAAVTWGSVEFGFTEGNPDCLSRIGFSFAKVPQS